MGEVFGRVARSPGGWARDLSLSATGPGSRFPEIGPLAEALFCQGDARSLREGFVFKPHANVRSTDEWSPAGQWACDLRNRDRLTWSREVHDLFGLPPAAPVEREWAVARYAAHSRSVLERVRGFALDHACGFVLDAEIAPDGADRRWIRVLALPEFRAGQIVRLHGLKRLL